MMNKTYITQRVGDMSQYAGYRQITFESGKGKGIRGFEAYNASGLLYTVLIDKCMDIYNFSYKGTNLAYISKNRLVSNNYFTNAENEFLYYWNAGMLTTCGLENAGPSCIDNNQMLPLHGRLHMLPAENICAKIEWIGDDYRTSFEGEIRQDMLWGMNLKVKRKISMGLFDNEILIEDELENLEPNPEEFMILYHFNFGYPLINEGARVIKPKGNIIPRDGQDTGNWSIIEAPLSNVNEQVFFHENKMDDEGFAHVGVINEELELGVYLKYSLQNLPILSQWKCRRPHDYVLGLEPSNCYIMGRTKERENGTLKVIPGYSKQKYSVKIGILDGKNKIREYEEMVNSI